MGNNSAKLNPETTKIMEHPVTTAILERNLPLLLDLVAEHLDSIQNIKVSFPNEEERYTIIFFPIVFSLFQFSNKFYSVSYCGGLITNKG